jgi:hypothetical protein
MLFAVTSQIGGPTGGRILDILVLATAAGLAYRFPRAVPYLAVFAVGLQSTLTRTFTSDGDALVGLAIGLSIARFRSRTFPTHLRPTQALLALTALNVVVIVSFLANMRGPNGHSVALASGYFISRSVLAAAVAFLSAQDRDWQHRWGQALGLLAFALSSYRLLEVVGLPLKPVTDALGIAMLGEYADPANANLFAVLAGVGISFLLADVALRDRQVQKRDWGRWLAAAIVTLAMASAESRTAVVIVAIVIISLLGLATTWTRRIAVGGLACVYLVGSLLPAFSIVQKPIIVAPQTAAVGSVATNQPPAVAPPETLSGGTEPVLIAQPPLPAIRPQWRSALDRSSYRAEAILPPAIPGRGHYLDFIAGRGGGAVSVTLNVSVNGTVVAQLRPSDMSTYYRWQEVPIPDAVVLTGKPLVVDLSAAGNVDSARNYFLIGGLYAKSNGYTSRFWSGRSWVTTDLSPDAGTQTGLFAVFVDGNIPPLAYFQGPIVGVIDPSITDRLFLWQTALNAFLHNPIFGTGFYTFGLVRSQYEPTDRAVFFSYANAHSNYLELLSDLGFAGPLLFLIVLAIPLVEIIRRIFSAGRPRDGLAVAMALALLAYIVSSLSQTWLADSRVYVTAWFVALVAGTATTAAAKSYVGVGRRGSASLPTV